MNTKRMLKKSIRSSRHCTFKIEDRYTTVCLTKKHVKQKAFLKSEKKKLQNFITRDNRNYLKIGYFKFFRSFPETLL